MNKKKLIELRCKAWGITEDEYYCNQCSDFSLEDMARAYRRGKNKGARDKAIQNVGFYQKQMQDIYDKKNKQIAELEDKLANADYQLEGRDNEIRELNKQLKAEHTRGEIDFVNMHCNSSCKKVKELEAQIEKMKCCGNCGNKRCTSKYRGNSAYHTQTDGFACADNEDWKPREIKEK